MKNNFFLNHRGAIQNGLLGFAVGAFVGLWTNDIVLYGEILAASSLFGAALGYIQDKALQY